MSQSASSSTASTSVLGYAVIAGSALTKIPQILNIVRAQSTAGLSLPMYLLESACQCVTICYHVSKAHAFAVWGENATLGAGNVVILFEHARLHGRLPVFVAGAGGALLTSRFLASHGGTALDALYAGTIFVYIVSRLPQIVSNWRAKSAGVLSPVTFAANGVGSIIRLITSAALGDRKMALFMLVSIICNYTLVGQILYYRYYHKQ